MSHHDSNTHYDAKHNPVGTSSTHHDSKVSSHNPLSNDLVGNVPLTMTSHHQEDQQGPRLGTVAHKHQDTFEGHSGNVHETVTKKETIVENTNRGLPQQVVQPVIVPVIQQVPIVQPVIQQQVHTTQQVHVQPTVQHDTTTVKTVIEPTVHRSVVEKATIVKETFLPEEKIEIQPVIHREREQTEVHKVVQPMHERDVMATKVVQATLADQVRSTVVESDAAFQARSREADTRFASTTEYAALKTQTVQKSAIIEEHIHKTIIEEVQPVLYKETVVPVIIQETQPIYEKIVEAPVVITEERAMRDLGTQFASSTVSDQRAFAHMGQGIIPPQSFVETTTTQIIREQIPGQQFVQGQHIQGQQYVQGQQFVGQQIPGQQYVQVIPGQQYVQGQQYVGQQIPGTVYDQQHHGIHGNQLAGTHHDQPHGQHGGLIGKIENALHGGSHSDQHHNQQFTNQQQHH